LTDIFDETDDIAVDLDEFPTVKVGTAGITSASQLIDTTPKIETMSDSTAHSTN